MQKYFLENNQLVTKASLDPAHFSLFNGDGVFTTFCIREGKVEFFEKHLQRLEEHAKSLNIEFTSFSKKSLFQLINKCGATTGFWKGKIVLLPDQPYLKADHRKVDKIYVFLEATIQRSDPFQLVLYPEDIGFSAPRIKSLAYMPRYYLKRYALEKKADDVLLTYQNYITETSFANFFWIHDKTLFYPAKDLPYFLGITLQEVLEAAKSLNMKIKQTYCSFEDLPKNSCCFLTNSLLGIHPITKIHTRSFSSCSPFSLSLKKAFNQRALSHSLSSI